MSLTAEGLFIVNWAVPPAEYVGDLIGLAFNAGYSSVGTGAAADGSPGEIEFAVNFTDDGAARQGPDHCLGHHQYWLSVGLYARCRRGSLRRVRMPAECDR